MNTFRIIIPSISLVFSGNAATVNFIQTSVNDANGAVLGAVNSSQYLDSGVSYSTVAAPSAPTGYRFTHWSNSASPDTNYRDAWGRALNPIQISLLENTTATAHYLPETLDSDVDGLPDWYEKEYFGDLTRAAGE